MTKILAVLEDVFFMVKINEAAKRAGIAVEFVKSEVDVLEKAKDNPPLIIVDLNFSGIDPLSLVAKLKHLKATSVIGYLSHVQGELKQQAQEAGYNMVLARSALSQNLPQILKRHGTAAR